MNRIVIALLFIFVVATQSGARAAEGSDLEIGGSGDAPGKFTAPRDMTFDDQNRLYVLESVRMDPKTKTEMGARRVQSFDAAGKFVAAFALKNEKGDPARIAVDSKHRIYVTDPKLGTVQQYDEKGALLKEIPLPGALAVSTWTIGGQERIAVVTFRQEGAKPGKTPFIDVIQLIDLDGNLLPPIPVSTRLEGVEDCCADRSGNLLVLAAKKALYQFDASGKLLRTVGSQSVTRIEDGSELMHSVCVDSKNYTYVMTWGNPGKVLRFDPDFEHVTTRGGQFKWADPWSVHSAYTVLQVDRNDRLWVLVADYLNPNTGGDARYHPKPVVVRAQSDFFAGTSFGTEVLSTELAGFRATLTTKLPYDISYDTAPITMSFNVPALNRRLKHIDVKWSVLDTWAKPLAQGDFKMDLKDGEESLQPFAFTPPGFGWYTVVCDISNGGRALTTVNKHVGVTPHFAGMPDLAEGQSQGGWQDAPRQVFCGLPLMRLHAEEDLGKLEKSIEQAEKNNAPFFVQLSDKKNCTPEFITAAVARFKGRVKIWEVMNEPNFSMSPEDYVKLAKVAYPLIKSIDPQAQVMGPDFCGIQLPMYETFYKNGGKDFVDILSIHDYEGHEGIDPIHWRWKMGALRELMAKYGDEKKPIWQTERAISSLRGVNFIGGVQAVRATLHRDLLETLGIPPEHNSHYYLNNGGYNSVPSYVWSAEGPFPAALALRARAALTLGHAYKGTLDFGASGNTFFMGLKYEGAENNVFVLRNLGISDSELSFALKGASEAEVIDCYGNVSRAAGAALKLTLSTMPVYVRVAKNASIEPEKWDFGRNVASRATFEYSAKVLTDTRFLNNEIIETSHAGHPYGGTGNKAFSAELPSSPQTLNVTLDRPRAISAVVLRGFRADNDYCALLDYDLQAKVGGEWRTLSETRTNFAPSRPAVTANYQKLTWYMDTNAFANRFETVTTDALRIVVRRATYGFVPDKNPAWSTIIDSRFMLREVEIYESAPTNALVIQNGSDGGVQVSASKAGQGALKVLPPQGWSAEPADAAAKFDGTAGSAVAVHFKRPETVASGTYFSDFEFRDGQGGVVDRSWSKIVVDAPMSVTPQNVKIQQGMATALIVGVKNLTDKTLDGSVRVEVTGASTVPAATATVPPVNPGETKSIEIPIANVPMIGQHWTATYMLTARGVSVSAKQELSVREWAVLGPLTEESALPLEKEAALDPSKGFTDRMGNELKWNVLQTNAAGFLDLTGLKPNSSVHAYALGFVNSPAAGEAVLAIGADDGAQAWVNGEKVITDLGAHGAQPGSHRAPIQLKKGLNTVLLRIHQSNGGWGFYAEITNPDGKVREDLRFQPSGK